MRLREAPVLVRGHTTRKQEGLSPETGIHEGHGLGQEGRLPSAPHPTGTLATGQPRSTPDMSTNSASMAWHLSGGVTDPEAQSRLSDATDGLQRFPWERLPSSQGTSPRTCAGRASQSCGEPNLPYIQPPSPPEAFDDSPCLASPPTKPLLRSSGHTVASSRHFRPPSHTSVYLLSARLASSEPQEGASLPFSAPHHLAPNWACHAGHSCPGMTCRSNSPTLPTACRCTGPRGPCYPGVVRPFFICGACGGGRGRRQEGGHG